MKRLLVDMSSVLWTALLAGKDEEYGLKVEHEGRVIQVNSAVYGYENAMQHIMKVLRDHDLLPKQLVLVVEGPDSKSYRKKILESYKTNRDSRPPQAYEQFNKLKGMLVHTFMNAGATAVTHADIEADDVIAYMAKTLDGEKIILSEDGDLCVLINENVGQIRKGELVINNPYGPFPIKHIHTFKAVVGDTSDKIPGAKGFGDKAWLNLCAIFGDDGLDLLADLIKNRELARLVEDVGDLKSLQKIIDGAEMVYRSWDAAMLYPQAVTSIKYIEFDPEQVVEDDRLRLYKGSKAIELDLPGSRTSKDVSKRPFHAVFDTEIIGAENPVFLCCTEVVETGERHAFWQHVEGDMERMKEYFAQPDITFVSFNGIGFDTPVMSAAASGVSTYLVKRLATQLIEDVVTYWDAHKSFDFKPMKFDQIDISEVVPGVRVSLKTYAGRMGYPTMQDMPIPHDVDPTPEQLPIIESYCFNDCGVTKALFLTQQTELDLRREISLEHGIDVRSKSDPQVAEAVMRVELGLGKSGQSVASVRYKAPDFIKTDNEVLNSIVTKLEAHEFAINKMNGQVEAPDFLKDPIKLGSGSYQFGVGGIHSTHDEKVCVWATENTLISDLDVSSYYPSLILRGGFVPKFEGDKGEKFMEIYGDIVRTRIAEKKRIEAIEANESIDEELKTELHELKVSVASKKLSANGLFGKLGSPYSPVYSPDLMLAVTITGQLHLACIIHDLNKINGVNVQSANTDGICIVYPPDLRDEMLNVFKKHSETTGFEYEETRYSVTAFANVNNYIAITTKGKAKRKGLYATTSLSKNPTMEVCSNLAVDYLREGVHPSVGIAKYTNIKDYVAIRAVRGGGIQFDHFVEVDDWVLVDDVGTKDNVWMRQKHLDQGKDIWDQGGAPHVKRKSRPHPVEVGVGGEPFGRVARWFMTTDKIPPISYISSGNKVPKTEGARVCMTLPTELPKDLDFDWYVKETLSMLKDMGVDV